MRQVVGLGKRHQRIARAGARCGAMKEPAELNGHRRGNLAGVQRREGGQRGLEQAPRDRHAVDHKLSISAPFEYDRSGQAPFGFAQHAGDKVLGHRVEAGTLQHCDGLPDRSLL